MSAHCIDLHKRHDRHRSASRCNRLVFRYLVFRDSRLLQFDLSRRAGVGVRERAARIPAFSDLG